MPVTSSVPPSPRAPLPAGGPAGPGVLDAVALLLEVADELVVGSVRDTHRAVADRVYGVAQARTGGAARVPRIAHDTVARGVYAAVGGSLRGAARGVGALADAGVGPRLEGHPAGGLLRAAVNGLIGDRLDAEAHPLAIPFSVRVGGEDVPLDPAALAAAYPTAGPRLVVLLHGLGENEAAWGLHREERGTTYVEELAEDGWTPVLLRMNSGLPLRANGVGLASLLERLVAAWPGEVERIALVGHSMGGLVVRAASAVVAAAGAADGADAAGDGEARRGAGRAWPELVTDVVTLGTPHRGAPLAGIVGHGSDALGRFAETGAFGRILDQRSEGIRDLVDGLAHDVPALPHARYRLVSATLTRSARHPVGASMGDLLVREQSAYGRRGRTGDDLFADVDVETLHVGGTGHFGLLNHPEVAVRLRGWLA